MVAKVEDHVARNPNDGKAWEVLAPVYMRIGRYDDAVRAWSNVISLNGSNAEREADFGEAMVAAANGVVTADAKAAFDRALKIDPQDVMARFYTGMAADQDGRRADAEKIWNDLIAGAPPNAPWIEVVRHALARNAPAAAAAAPAAAAQSAPPDHEVNAMVERLAERLKKDGSDVQGWLQLVRSYRVLDQNDKMAGRARRRPQGAGRRCRQAAPVQRRRRSGHVGGASAGAGCPGRARSRGGGAGRRPAQDQSIVAMVQRLADRLKKDGSDVNGWLQLVRSYRVLEQQDKMQAALADARKALAGDPDKLKQFNAGVDAATSVAAAAPPMAPAARQPPRRPACPGRPRPTSRRRRK